MFLFENIGTTAVDWLAQYGFYQVILPFVLIFLVAFVALKASKIVEDNLLSAGISLVISLIATLFLANVPIVGDFLAFVLGKAGIILIIILVILVVNAFVKNNLGGKD